MRSRLIASASVALAAIAVAAPLASGSKVVKNVGVIDFAFTPKTLTISKGTAVRWTWGKRDFSAHNVTLTKGPSGVKKRDFTSTTSAHHKPFERTFNKAGTYRFVCTIHAFMTLKVVVR